MEIGVKKTVFSPKAIIHQKFANKACYTVEEVKEESAKNGCPGLAIPHKGPSLFRCRLELPEFTVVSDICRKKKDAEQSAADLALKKLGNNPADENPSEKDPCDALIDRIKYLFTDEFLSSLHPLSGHLRAALQRKGGLYGLIPASVIAACDTKTSNLCKLLNPEVESKPFLALSSIMRAIPRLSGSVVTSKGQLSIQKQNPYPTEIIESSDIQQSGSPENILVKAIQIPASLDETIQPVTLDISSSGYYLDVIAQKLGVTDASRVLLSRTIGKASSDTRLYFAASESLVMELLSDHGNVKDFHVGLLNARANYFCGQEIYGDAIMASVGYTWRSKELFHEDVSLQSYYRMLVSKIPSGNYKLSREAILAAELPSVFTTKTNWRGSFPREILCTFCRQHQLSEPIFSTTSIPLKASCKLPRSQKKLKVTEAAELATEYTNGESLNAGDGESVGLESSFRCTVKVFSKGQDVCLPNIEGSYSGVCSSNGSLLCISYSVSLVTEGGHTKELIESKDEFEFEIGNGTVVSTLEGVVTQMSVGQCAHFNMNLPPQEFILAAVDDPARIRSLLSSEVCCLEYHVTLLRVTEPPEERMEQALFSPPLSKQRVEYAVQHIKKSSATTLVDFGCGSGSLLDSLLDYPTSLEKIVGADLSKKSLSRAAKILHAKLSAKSDTGIKSAILYDGSITEFDPRLCGFDIGTCLEVIEHMEEEQACLFGDIALSFFRPKVLIVSTPNYEYNVILQGSSPTTQEEDPEEKRQSQSCKFRNHDHKFEWTREQFNHWASGLAKRHHYSVEFSGVGGSGDVEPGFASQIAVFKQESLLDEDDLPTQENSSEHCKVIWEWSCDDRSVPSSTRN
ncbi:small RNA 2'-O-methyltransferase isoform X3 [Populus alba]|uniref:small RNA 2'-O-methyltransferase isoform X3 n=1 Tax=Populus alba TaxID=43335 RepID=UPI00158B8E02|nr:small RNA 2'-O-methyltransferase-like isoform X4 [Populus alba]